MSAIEVKGKSVDEAIFNGLNELGASIDEVVIEIIKDGSKGFLGFGKSAEVRLTPKAEIPGYIENEEVKPDLDETEHRGYERRERPERRERGDRGGRGRERGGRERNYDRERGYERSEGFARSERDEEPISIVEEEYEYIDACAGETFMTELIAKMGVEAECKTVKNKADADIDKVVITGKDTAVLIGRRGETLDALQYLCGLAINRKKEDYKKIMIDTENYRAKREETLVRLANRIAGKVARTGRKVTLEPMNPYERRILHYTLQSSPRVETVSEGEDPYRRVVVRPKRRGGRTDS